MYRIDNATAAAALPTPAAVGPNPNGYFTKGNPSTGVAATIVDDDWANAVQEELANVIEEAGLELDKTDRAQLKAAITAMMTSAAPNIAFNYYLGTTQSFTGSSVQFKPNTQRYNYGNFYDAGTGGFTPTVAGIYKITMTLHGDVGTAPNYVGGSIRKNGLTAIGSHSMFCLNTDSEPSCTITADVYLNGTTDYVDFIVGSTAASASILGNESSSVSGYLVKKI